MNSTVLGSRAEPRASIWNVSPGSPLLRCFALYREMPWRFSITGFLFLVGNVGLALQQWLIGRAVHDVERGVAVVRQADGALDYRIGLGWLALLASVALGRGVVLYLGGVSALIIGQELLYLLRVRILAQVQRLDLAYHREHGVGGMVTRTTRDADKMRDALISFWRQVVETAILVLVAVGMLCWYAPLLGLVPLIITLSGLAIFVLQTNHLVTLDRAVGNAYDTVNQNLSEGVNGIRVVKAFGLERDAQCRLLLAGHHLHGALLSSTGVRLVPHPPSASGDRARTCLGTGLRRCARRSGKAQPRRVGVRHHAGQHAGPPYRRHRPGHADLCRCALLGGTHLGDPGCPTATRERAGATPRGPARAAAQRCLHRKVGSRQVRPRANLGAGRPR